MKRTKTEALIYSLEILLSFFDRHPITGKAAVSITAVFLGCITLLLALKFCAPELVLIIEALK